VGAFALVSLAKAALLAALVGDHPVFGIGEKKGVLRK
jgi:hypothetical protein